MTNRRQFITTASMLSAAAFVPGALAQQPRKQERFILGIEHGNATRGEVGGQAVIDAYRAIDPA